MGEVVWDEASKDDWSTWFVLTNPVNGGAYGELARRYLELSTQWTVVEVPHGHGHVRPRPDGFKARCGGPAICAVCAEELKLVARAEAWRGKGL